METEIDDCLVLFFGIASYENKTKLSNLPSITNDYEYFHKTFKEHYGYTFISNKYKELCNKISLIDYLTDIRDNYLINKKEIEYNGLIIGLAGHGSNNNIICSNGDKISLKTIRSLFSSSVNRKFENLPKIFIINACRNDYNNNNLPKSRIGGIRISIIFNNNIRSIRR